MANCLILDESEYATYGLSTGSSQSALISSQAEIAVSITEDSIEDFLNTALCPTQFTERFTWPGPQMWRQGPRPLQVSKDRIISIDLITTYHEKDKCDCETESYTGCHYIKDAASGIIEVNDDCWAGTGCECCCTCSPGAFMVDVSGTYGFTDAELAADTSDGRTVRFWIARWAQEVFDAMQGNPSSVTASGVIQWSSMNYSERLAVEVVKDTMFGSSPLANSMATSLRRLSTKRAIKFGGRR
jgi:hypothetical protein